jgi:hypothetical protein
MLYNIFLYGVAMKLCKTCHQEKPFDPTKKPYAKASGFHANVCWTCYTEAQARRYQDNVGLSDPKVQALRTELAKVKKVKALERMAMRLKLQFNLPE